MNVTRYWKDGENFCSSEGELTTNNDFTFKSAFGKRTIFNGYHFASKDEAFKSYCDEIDEKIEELKNKVEVLRTKL